MQMLFKHTPLNAFTEKRQHEVRSVLDVINSHADFQLLAKNAKCLAEIVPLLSKKHKLLCMPLFHGLDMLWALHRDGCDINQEIVRHEGFLYDFHEADLVDSENMESPVEMLNKIGLHYLAFSLNGLAEPHRTEATIELTGLLSTKIQKFSRPLPQQYGITRILKDVSDYAQRVSVPHSMDLLRHDCRLDQDQKNKLTTSINSYINHVLVMPLDLDIYHSVRDAVFRSYVYDYAVSMKTSRLGIEDIIHNLEFVINHLLTRLNFLEENASAYRRCFLINACMPYSDLLKAVKATSRELSSGVSLQIVSKDNIPNALNVHFSGIIFTAPYQKLLVDIVENFREDGYSVGFNEAIHNSGISFENLATLLRLANGYTTKVDVLLGRKDMPENHFRSIMKEVSLDRLKSDSINNLYFHICNYHAKTKSKYSANTGYNNLRWNMFSDTCANYVKSINGFLGNDWKATVLPYLMQKMAITVDSCRILGLTSNDLKYLVGADPVVKRMLLSQDMGMDP